jgi:tetratricopeptide (TPR) repeat protein
MPRPRLQFSAPLVIFLLGALFVAIPLAAQNAEVSRLMQAGAQKYRAGDFDGAVALYHQAAALQPSDPNILLALAQALGDQGTLPEAERIYLKLPSLYEQLQSHAARGGTYRPNIAVAWNNLAALYCRDNRFDDARAANDRAFAAWPTPNSAPAQFFITRGLVLDGLKQPNPAIQAYLTAIQKDPRSSDAYLNLGTLLLVESRFDDALKVLQKGVSVSSHDGDMFAVLGNAFAKKYLWNDAASAYRKSLDLRPDGPEVMFNLATSLEHLGKTSESLEVLQRAHQLAPGDAAISASLGAALVKTGRKPEAETFVSPATGKPAGEDAWSSYTRATALADENRNAEALVLVSDTLRAKPDFPEATALWGNLQLETGHSREAVKAVADALAAHPDSPELLNTTGLLQMAEVHLAEAEASFSKALAQRPEFLDAQANHGVALLLQHRRAAAISEFQVVLKADSLSLKAQANLATAYYELARYPEACEAFARAVQLSPEDPDLRTNLALALEKAGRAAEAKQAFADAKRLRPIN